MSWLDKFFPRPINLSLNGVPLPPESIINFGSGLTAADNPSFGRTDLTASASGPGGVTGDLQTNNGAGGFTGLTPTTTGFVLRATGANTAAFGALNLANASAVTGTLPLANVVAPTGTGIPHISAGAWVTATSLIVNADVDAAAAIAYSKLNLATSVVNADIATAAAIAYSKLGGAGAETINPQSFKATVNAKCQPTYVEGKNIQTTDATTAQTLDSFTLASGTGVVWTATVLGVLSGVSGANSYSVVATFVNNAGTVSQVGTTTVTALHQSDATWVGPTMTFSGTTITLSTKGKASTTIQWGAVSTQVPVIP